MLPHPAKTDRYDVLLLVIAIPLIEEYLFRGVIFTWLGKYFRPATIIFITSTLFVITHPGDQLLVLVFLVNIMCGISRQSTGTFASSWICRIVYHAVSFLLLTSPNYFMDNHILTYLPLIFGVLMLISMQLFRSQVNKRS